MRADPDIHRRTSEDLASLALGLSGASLSDESLAHAKECAQCRRELAEHAQVAAALAIAVSPAYPSGALRGRILDAAHLESVVAPTPVASTSQSTPTSWWSALWRQLTPAAALAAVAVVIAVVVSVAFAVEMSRLTLALESERQARRSLEARVEAYEVVVAELARPGLMVLELQGTGPASTASGRLYLNPSSTTAVLATNGLQPAEAGRVYQLWLIRDGQRTSGGTFTTDSTGTGTLVITAPHPLSVYQAVGVTIEPAGGSPGPTGPRVLAGTL